MALQTGRGASRSGLVVCPGCTEAKKPGDWGELELDLDPESPEPMCLECRTKGIPQKRQFTMPLHHQLALDAYFTEIDPKLAMRAAMKASGLSRATIYNLMNGRSNPAWKAAFQTKLQACGADYGTLADKLVEGLGAMENKYHPAKEEYVHFDDHRTRLGYIRHLTRLLDLDSGPGRPAGSAVQVNVITNLGRGEEIAPPNVMGPAVDGEVIDID